MPDADRRRVLVTNDDGIDSPGLQLLAPALAEDHDVVVAAPDTDLSGAGTAIGQFDPDTGIQVVARHVEGVAEAYAVSGPPGLAVVAAHLGAFGPRPDLVVSGINRGLNTGHAVIQSGTVGGALTAQTFGLRGLAVSQVASDPMHWPTAVEVAVPTARWLLDQTEGTTVNLNTPALEPGQVRGARWAPLDDFGHVRATANIDGERLTFDPADRADEATAESDTALCLEGYVTLTPLRPVAAGPMPDVDAAAVTGLGARG